jgi:hypothetical protein
VKVDVKLLTLKRKNGTSVRRYQYTAIDDGTRVRALKIYRRHTQANAIDFINYVVEKFPFRIRTIRTDKGEFYQLLTYRDDVDLGKKLAEWERFYNFDRPHGDHRGKTPYESLRHNLSWRRPSILSRNITLRVPLTQRNASRVDSAD